MFRGIRGAVLLLVVLAGLLQANFAAAEHITGGIHFRDVPEGHPDYRYIAYLSGKKIISGYPDGRFGPDDPLTRSAATKIAVQAAGFAARLSGPAPAFTDLPSTHWSVPFVRTAVAEKIVQGFQDRTFRPEAQITRAELAALAVRATRQSQDRIPELALPDVAKTDWFYKEATLALASGMMEAKNGRFRPNAIATRAEAARAFAQAMTFTPQVYGKELSPIVKPSRGKVEVALPGSTEFTLLQAERPLPVGSRVRTSAASAADIIFPDGSGFYLDNNSEMILVQSRGAEMIGGLATEELEVELVRGQLFGALTPRIAPEDLVTYQSYLSFYSNDPGKDERVIAALAEEARARAASSHSGKNLPKNAAKLILFVNPASLEPGDKEGSELTIILADEAGEPIVASDGDVTIELLTDVGRISNTSPVIPKGYQAVQVQIFPPDKEPEDAKTRVTAVAGEITSAITIPTAKTGWFSSVFSKKTRAKVRMPWSVASIRGSYVSANVSAQNNSVNVLGGDATLSSLSGNQETLQDNQSARVTSPTKPPSNPAPLDVTEQQQWNAQKDWVSDQKKRIEAAAPAEVSKEVRDEHERIANLVTALPPDTVSPSITISGPANDLRVGTPNVTVRGVASDNVKLTSVSVNGSSADVDERGNWSATISLTPGNNTLTAVAVDGSGNTSTARVRVIYDAAAPSITLTGPKSTKEKSATFTGVVTTPGGLDSLTVNGRAVSVGAGGAFTFTAELQPGRNLIVAQVADRLGRQATAEHEISSATVPPVLNLETTPQTVARPLVTVAGQAVAQYARLSAVTVNGTSVLFSGEGSFTAAVNLKAGANQIAIEATDDAGNKTSRTITVTADAAAPSLLLSQPKDGAVTREATVTVQGSARTAAGFQSLTVNGAAATPDPSGAFTATVPLNEGANNLTVQLTDALGRTASESVVVNRATKPPTLVLTQPEEGKSAAARQITVSGAAAAAFGSIRSVTVNGRSMLIGPDGSFAATIELQNGANTITATATDVAGNTASVTRSVTFNPAAPTISLSEPRERLVTNQNSVSVSGSVTNPGAARSVTVNGQSAPLSADGSFSARVELAPGQNVITAAMPTAGAAVTVVRTVIYTITPPTLSVSSPNENSTTARPEVLVSGSALTSYGTPANVSINGLVVPVDGAGGFSLPLSLRPGKLEITVTATDDAGNTVSSKRTVEYTPALPVISITEPAAGLATREARVTVRGTVSSTVGIKSVSVNGRPSTVDAAGNFAAVVDLAPGPNAISVSATDTADGTSTTTVNVARAGLPPTLTIATPSEGQTTGSPDLTVTGRATAVAGTITSVTVNGNAAAVGPDGSWVARAALVNGENTLTVVALDSLGGTASASRKVTLAQAAPTLELVAPADGLVTAQRTLVVSGKVKASAAISSLTVNGSSVSAGPDGSFQTSVSLNNGRNSISVTVTDSLGRTASVTRTVTLASQAPSIALIAPADGATVSSNTVTVSGTVTVQEGVRIASVTVNGSAVTPGSNGSFSATVTLPLRGSNTITVVATDAGGNSTTVRRTVTFTPAPPSLTVSSPSGSTVNSATLTVSGTASSPNGGLSVTVNGVTAPLGADGSFSTTVTLTAGVSTAIRVTATDLYGETTVERTVTFTQVVTAPPPPPPAPTPTAPTLTVAAATGQFTDPVALTATLARGSTAISGKVIAFSVDGAVVGTAVTNASGAATFSYVITKAPGTYTVAASFAGDSEAAKADGSGTLTVTPESATLVYTGSTSPVGGTLVMSAKLTQEADGSIASDLSGAGAIRFTLTRVDTGAVAMALVSELNSDGVASDIAEQLPMVAYSLQVTYVSGTHFTVPSSSPIAIKLGPVVIVDPVGGQYSDTVQLSATISDATGNLQGKTIEFYVGSTLVGSAATNANGRATLPYSIGVGPAGTDFTIEGRFAGDASHSPATATSKLTVLAEQAGLIYTGVSQTGGGALALSALLTAEADGSPGDLTFAGQVKFQVRSATDQTLVDEVLASVSANDLASGISKSLPSRPYQVEISLESNGSWYTVQPVTTVIKGTPALTTASLSGEYSDPVTLSATLTDGGGPVGGKVIGFYVGEALVGTADTSGAGVATLPYKVAVPAGQSTVTATLAADTHYLAATGTGALTVTQESATLKYTGATAVSQSQIQAAATLTEASDGSTGVIGQAGNLSFVVRRASDGEVVASRLAAVDATGTASITIDGGVNQPYTVEVSLPNSSYYTAQSVTSTVRAGSSLAAANAASAYSDKVELSATMTPAAAGKTIQFFVGDLPVGTGLTNGSGTATYLYTVSNGVGTPAILAAFSGDDLYTPATSSASVLTVAAESATLEYTGETRTAGGNLALKAKLTEAADQSAGEIARAGTVLFVIKQNDTTAATVDTASAVVGPDGVASASVSNLPNAPYLVEVSLKGDGDYTAVPVVGHVQSITAVTAASASGTYSDLVNLSATLTPARSGQTVTFAVDGVTMGEATTDTQGTATFSYKVAKGAGQYAVKASYEGNALYSSASGSGTLAVQAESASLAYTGETVTSGGALTLAAQVTEEADNQSGELSAAGTVSFKVTNLLNQSTSTHSAAVNASGTATLTLQGQAHAPYLVELALAGATHYTAPAAQAVIKAASAIAVDELLGQYSDTVTLRAVLSPGVSGKEIQFKVGTTLVGTAATVDGAVTLPYVLAESAGIWPVTASFAGDSQFTAGSGSANLAIDPESAALTYTGALTVADGEIALAAKLTEVREGAGDQAGDLSKAGTIRFVLRNAGNQAVATKDLQVGSDGQVATSSGTLPNEPYTVEVSLLSNDHYTVPGGPITAKIRGTTTLSADAAAVQYGDSVTLRAVISPAVAGKAVGFTVGGTPVGTGTTSADGEATVSWTADKVPGSYTVAASFAGDGDYTAHSASSSLTLKHETATLTYTGSGVADGGALTLQANLAQDADGSPTAITNAGTVRFTLTRARTGADAGTFEGAVQADGTATVTAANLPPYRYNVAVELVSNDYFAATAVTAVVKAAAVVSVSAASGQYSDAVVLSASATGDEEALNGRSLSFTVNGTPIGTSTVTDGVATASYTIGLSAGSYTVTAAFEADDTYGSGSGSAALTVSREYAALAYTGQTVMPASGPSAIDLKAAVSQSDSSAGTYAPPAVQVEFTLKSLDGATVETVTASVPETGAAAATSAALTNRPYDVTVSLKANDYYTAGPATARIKATPTLTVDAKSGQYSDKVDLTATLTDGAGPVAGKTVSFRVDGAEVGNGLTNSLGVATVANYQILLPAGGYTIQADFAGDGEYLAASDTDSLTAAAEAATLSYTGDAALSHTGGTLNLSAQLTQESDGDTGAFAPPAVTVRFTIKRASDGQTVETVDAAVNAQGQASGVSHSLTGQPYTIGLQVLSNGYYSAPEAAAAATVKVTPSLTAEATSGQYSDTVTLSATLSDGSGGIGGKTVQFTVNGVAAGDSVTDGNGVATANYPIGLGAGTYTITASFGGAEPQFAGASATNTLTVTQEDATLSYTGDALAAGGAFTLRAQVSPAADDGPSTLAPPPVTVEWQLYYKAGAEEGTLARTETAAVNSQGVAELSLTDLAARSYDVKVQIQSPNSYYTAPMATAVIKTTPVITVTGVSGQYSDDVTLAATVTADGGAVAGRSLSFTVNGVPFGNTVTDASGVASSSYTIGLGAGTYTIQADFAGDGTYGPAGGSGSLTVSKEDLSFAWAPETTTNMTTGGLNLKVTLAGSDGTAGDLTRAGSVRFVVKKVGAGTVAEQVATVDASGMAETTVTVDPFAYDVTASLEANSYYAAASTTTHITASTSLSFSSSTVEYSDQVSLVATLSPAVSGKTVTFAFNGKSLTAQTDENGIATLPYTATDAAGTYPVTVSFAGDSDFLASSGTGSLTVSKETVVLMYTGPATIPSAGGTLTLSVSMAELGADTSTGTIALANQVQFVVKDENNTQVTGNTAAVQGDGTAAWTTPILAAKAYTVEMSLFGSQHYQATLITATVKVHTSVAITALVGTQEFSDSVTLSATLTPNVADKTVVFKVGGTAVGAAVTNSSGVASLPYAVDVSAGSHTVTAEFAGDDVHAASSPSATTLTVAAESATLQYTGPTLFTAGTALQLSALLTPSPDGTPGDLTKAGNVQFVVERQGVKQSFTAAVNASGTASVSAGLTPGTYSVTAALASPSYYQAASATATVYGPTTLTVNSPSVQYSDSISLTAELKVDGVPLGSRAVSLTITHGGTSTTLTPSTHATTGIASSNFTANLPAGSYPISASFTDSFGTYQSASAAGTLTVTPENATLTISSVTPSPMSGDGPLTLTASVAPESDGALGTLTNAGPVIFTVTPAGGGTAATYTATVNNSGVATATTVTLPQGSYTISATLTANGYFTSSSTPSAKVTSSSSLSLTDVGGNPVASYPGTYSDQVTLYAKLSPAISGKAIGFSVGSVHVGTGTTDANGIASVIYTVAAPGVANVEARFYGDSQFGEASSNVDLVGGLENAVLTWVTEPVNNAGTLTVQVRVDEESDGSAGNIGQVHTIRIEVLDATGVTTVQFFNASVSNQEASRTFTVTAGTVYRVRAIVYANNYYTGSETTSVKVGTSLALSVSPSTVASGTGTATLTATLTPAVSGKTVVFKVGTETVEGGQTDNNGQVSIPYTPTAAGTYTVTASFAGDSQYTAAASGGQTLTVTE